MLCLAKYYLYIICRKAILSFSIEIVVFKAFYDFYNLDTHKSKCLLFKVKIKEGTTNFT